MNHHGHAVRTKQKVLGRKVKTDVGKPGIARAKAIQLVGSVLMFKCVCSYVIVHISKMTGNTHFTQKKQNQSWSGN